jgi:hypothetical protein
MFNQQQFNRVNGAGVKDEILRRCKALEKADASKEETATQVEEAVGMIATVAALMTLVGGLQTTSVVISIDFNWPEPI